MDLQPGTPIAEYVTAADGARLVGVAPGELVMGARDVGAEDADDAEGPPHRASLTRGSPLGRAPVTRPWRERSCRAPGLRVASSTPAGPTE